MYKKENHSNHPSFPEMKMKSDVLNSDVIKKRAQINRCRKVDKLQIWRLFFNS